ncbi:hypothetical protein ACM66B_004640 [Microbotryomycetes sp. NB124-2]
MSYATPPSTCTLKLEPFRVNVPQTDINELQALLKASRVAPQVYENSRDDRKFGLTYEWTTDALEYWKQKFDWRAQEDKINEFPQFTTIVKDKQGADFKIHFMALFSSKPDAVPILASHGWPGNYCEFLKIFKLLRNKYNPEELPFSVIAPSLPGFVWSQRPPLDRDWDLTESPYILNELMTGLGFEAYVAQGGDIGATMARQLGIHYSACKAVHLNFAVLMRHEIPKDLSGFDHRTRRRLERTNDFFTKGHAYAREQGTKPGTLGFVLSSNPVSLFAWIAEKFLAWSDDDLSLDEILMSVSLYWFSNCIASSWPTYRFNTAGDLPGNYVKKPLGFSVFPWELAGYPREWIADTGNLVHYREHESGGHFAAVEKPEELLDDVQDFISQVWQNAKDAKL